MHHLIDDIVYGPVESRRYGKTFGVNPIPGGTKVCSFNCVYCQLGWTPQGEPETALFATPDEIRTAMATALARPEAKSIDAIVCCGNGEPSMHPDFPAFVEAMIESRDRHLPDVPIILLTNGGGLTTPENLDAAARLDEVAVKLDAGSYRTLRKVNLPRDAYDLVEVVQAITDLPNSAVQACFFDGRPSNTSDEDVTPWLAALRRAQPQRVDIYTVARTPPASSVMPASVLRLEEIAHLAREAVQVPVRVFPNDH